MSRLLLDEGDGLAGIAMRAMIRSMYALELLWDGRDICELSRLLPQANFVAVLIGQDLKAPRDV